jgi:ABC-2 type transport system ATP-binding protein
MTSPQIAEYPPAAEKVREASLISVRDVSMRFPITRRYRELLLHPLRPPRASVALTNINLQIEKGDRVAVMGPNGAGKTTLLKLIGGLLLPSEGDILVNGFNTLRHSQEARKSVGFVLNEERSFFWRLTAVQNLEFFGALDNLSGADLRRRIDELIDVVGLAHSAGKPVSSFSSGMKQRLALARGLIAEPEVLILDEPTRALDPVATEELIELILGRIHKGSRKTLLIATHSMDDVEKLCNKILIVNHGQTTGTKPISDLAARGISPMQYYRRSVLPEGK